MIKINKLDFQLCRIPEHQRIAYEFVRNGETYLTFDYQYLQEIINECSDVSVKRLQATNHIRTHFKTKKIVDADKKLFKLTN